MLDIKKLLSKLLKFNKNITEPTFFSGTRNSAFNGGFCYGWESNGVVDLFFSCSSASAIKASDVLYTIPAAYRPSSTKNGPVIGIADSGQIAGRFSITSDGEIKQGASNVQRAFFGAIRYTLGGVVRRLLNMLISERGWATC